MNLLKLIFRRGNRFNRIRVFYDFISNLVTLIPFGSKSPANLVKRTSIFTTCFADIVITTCCIGLYRTVFLEIVSSISTMILGHSSNLGTGITGANVGKVRCGVGLLEGARMKVGIAMATR